MTKSCPTTAVFFASSLKTVWVAPHPAAAVEDNAQCPQPEVASAGYHEASLVFLLGTGTRLVDGEGAARFLADGGCRIALATEPQQAAFMATLAGLSRQAELLDHVAGMNTAATSASTRSRERTSMKLGVAACMTATTVSPAVT
jgi:hypothetical protein